MIAYEQVHSDNDASEVDILGHFETFWDNSEDILTCLEFLTVFPVISDNFHSLSAH